MEICYRIWDKLIRGRKTNNLSLFSALWRERMLFQYIKKFFLFLWVQAVSISFLLAMASVSFAQLTAQDHAA
ncbi:TPA: oxidoreductase, partial [Legionella pneumophila]|nr:oxidoreductase [Legionella pneumophila]